MKYFCLLILSIVVISEASAQDTIKVADAANYVGKIVTFRAQPLTFDSRAENIYLYYFGHWSNQWLTVIVKRTNGKNRIKLKRDIMFGLRTVYFTGTITKYSEEPDTTANYDIKSIQKEFKETHPVTVAAIPGSIFHQGYVPTTGPIDLRGKMVMIITEQSQIGKKSYSNERPKSNPLSN